MTKVQIIPANIHAVYHDDHDVVGSLDPISNDWKTIDNHDTWHSRNQQTETVGSSPFESVTILESLRRPGLELEQCPDVPRKSWKLQIWMRWAPRSSLHFGICMMLLCSSVRKKHAVVRCVFFGAMSDRLPILACWLMRVLFGSTPI